VLKVHNWAWGTGIPSGKMVANSLGVHRGVDPREHGVG